MEGVMTGFDRKTHAKRLGTPALLALAALALSACGQGGGGNDAANAFTAAFDKSFNESFDRSTHDSCVSSATAHGGAADAAEKYCSCVVAQLDKLSVKEKEGLTPESPVLAQAAGACRGGS
jgi:hypothetical protein